MLKLGSTLAAIPSRVKNVRISSRTYGGVNINQRGDRSRLRTVAIAPNLLVPPSAASIAWPSSPVNCANPRSSPVASSTPKARQLSLGLARKDMGSVMKPASLNALVTINQSSESVPWIPRAKASIIFGSTALIRPKSRKQMLPSSASMRFPSCGSACT